MQCGLAVWLLVRSASDVKTRFCRLECGPVGPREACIRYDTIRYDTIRDASFNVRLKADISQLNLQHGTDNIKGENRKT